MGRPPARPVPSNRGEQLGRTPTRLTLVGWIALALGLPLYLSVLRLLLYGGYIGNAVAVLDGPSPDTLEHQARAAGVLTPCEAAVRALGLTPVPVPLPRWTVRLS